MNYLLSNSNILVGLIITVIKTLCIKEIEVMCIYLSLILIIHPYQT